MDLIYRAMPIWPHPPTPAYNRRGPGTFQTAYPKTLRDLARELSFVDGREPQIYIGVHPEQIRRDGRLRSVNGRAPNPIHPGIEIQFDSPLGRQVYHSDACERWTHNVRSIVLGLESLRAVERYGIGGRGEQYRGFLAELAESSSASTPTIRRGLVIIERTGSVVAALRATHPDNGGDAVDFASVNLAKDAGA